MNRMNQLMRKMESQRIRPKKQRLRHLTPSQSEAEIAPKPSVPKRPRGRPLGSGKPKPAIEDDESASPPFNVSVWVEIPNLDPIITRSTSRKRADKVEKQEPWLLGPATLHQDMDFEQLLEKIDRLHNSRRSSNKFPRHSSSFSASDTEAETV
jgi:hypothetical protein